MATRSFISGAWTVTCDDSSENEVWTNGFTLVQNGDVMTIPANVPTGGTWSLGSASGLAFNITAAALKTALSGAGIIPATATVDGDYLQGYMITWPSNGAQAALPAGSAASLTNGLSPNRLSVNIGELNPGTASEKEIQTITIGTAWSSKHTSSKAFTLKGAGADRTIIANNAVGSSLLVFNEVANQTMIVTGLSIASGTSYDAGAINANCVLRFVGQSENSGWRIRVHHNRLIRLPSLCIYTSVAFGVVDHNIFDSTAGMSYNYDVTWAGLNNGDGSWGSPTSYATDKMIYYEDNVANLYKGSLADGTRGGRVCIRHNTVTMLPTASGAVMSCHGLEDRARSIRLTEFYNNYVVTMRDSNLTRNRGGTLVVFNNRVDTCTTGTPQLGMQWDRGGTSGVWGRGSGNNPYDKNDLSGTVNSFNGHTYAGTNADPKPFFVGTATSGSGSNTLVDSTASFPTAGSGLLKYCVTDLDASLIASDLGIPQFTGGVIVSNTATSITTGAGTFGGSPVFVAGHKYAIWRIDQAMDMAGRAGISSTAFPVGNPPAPSSCGATAQVTEPWYEWNNILLPSTDIQFSISSIYIPRLGEHAINNTVKPGYTWDAASSSVCGAQYAGAINATVTGKGGFTYPHPLTGSVLAPVISSLLTAGSTIGMAFSYSIEATNSPVSFAASPLPTGFTINTGTGEIACTALANTGQPGTYNISISATNSGGTDTQTLVLTLLGTGGVQRGKGRAIRIGSMGSSGRF